MQHTPEFYAADRRAVEVAICAAVRGRSANEGQHCPAWTHASDSPWRRLLAAIEDDGRVDDLTPQLLASAAARECNVQNRHAPWCRSGDTKTKALVVKPGPSGAYQVARPAPILAKDQ